MTFAPADLVPLGGSVGWSTERYGYATTDTLATASASGYFNARASILKVGDLIDVTIMDAVDPTLRTTAGSPVTLQVLTNNGTTVTTKNVARLDFKAFGAVGNGTTDDTVALNAAIAWMNAGGFRTLYVIGGNYLISTVLDTITRSDSSIISDGARITQGGDTGAVFVVGTTTTNAARIRIKGFGFFFTGTPGQDDYLLDLVRTGDSEFSDFTIADGTCLVRYGGSTSASVCTRVFMQNWSGDVNLGTTSDAHILVRHGSNGIFRNFRFNGAGGGNSGTKAVIKLKPGASQSLDTFLFDWCTFQIFTVSATPATSDGKAYGVYIDRTLGDITNLWFTNNSIDHTTTRAFYFVDNGGSVTTPTDRNINIINNRFGTDAGGGIEFDLTNPASGLICHNFQIVGNFIAISDNSYAIRLRGRTCVGEALISGNRIGDQIVATSKTAAISFDCSRVTVVNNIIASIPGTNSGFLVAVVVEHADNDKFVIQGNNAPTVATYVSEPTYTSTSSARRIDYRACTVLTLPVVKNIGAQVFVTNEAGGATLAYSDGTNWLRVADRAVVS